MVEGDHRNQLNFKVVYGKSSLGTSHLDLCNRLTIPNINKLGWLRNLTVQMFCWMLVLMDEVLDIFFLIFLAMLL